MITTPIPGTMQAVHLLGHGGFDQLVVRNDVSVPTPAAGEVLIEVSACGMNNTDIWVREGAYGTPDDADAISSWRPEAAGGDETLTFPRIQGADTAGVIAAVGDGVSQDRVGERVMVDFSIYNGDGISLANIDYIGHGRDGGYAEYVCVPHDHAWEVTAPISDAEAATFCCAYLTGEHMLDRAAVTAGERVLITGASGGVGSGLIQLCRARGAIPYAVTSPGKEDALIRLGAEAVVTREAGNLPEAVATATGGASIDVAADLVAGPLFNDLIRILRVEGRYVAAGAIGGAVVELDVRRLYLKHLQLHGSSQGTRAAFRRLHGYIESGVVKPVLDRTYRLSDIHRAQTDFMAKKYIGKLVMVPDRKWDETGAPHAGD
ncbi:MAG: alcohol dehydrogenase family protein [Hyphomicrobiaceae bacterium]